MSNHKQLSDRKVTKIANYIRFYSPTREELQKEFNLAPQSLKHYLTEMRKRYGMKRELIYKIE